MIWGLKTVAIFDVWSLEHLLSGMSIGYIAIQVRKIVFNIKSRIIDENFATRYFELVLVLLVAYFWETVEHYLESGIAGAEITYWFQGVEYWPNRIISDPLITLSGYYISKRFQYFVTPARLASLLWLYINIFIFPNSMYLQEAISI